MSFLVVVILPSIASTCGACRFVILVDRRICLEGTSRNTPKMPQLLQVNTKLLLATKGMFCWPRRFKPHYLIKACSVLLHSFMLSQDFWPVIGGSTLQRICASCILSKDSPFQHMRNLLKHLVSSWRAHFQSGWSTPSSLISPLPPLSMLWWNCILQPL